MTVIWETNKSILEKKFQKTVTVCKDFRQNINLDKYVVMKISTEGGEHGKDKM
jgi:hypothetical protein